MCEPANEAITWQPIPAAASTIITPLPPEIDLPRFLASVTNLPEFGLPGLILLDTNGNLYGVL